MFPKEVMFYSRVSLLEKRRLLEWPVWVVVGDPHHPTEAQPKPASKASPTLWATATSSALMPSPNFV